jgi:hypothetical protein
LETFLGTINSEDFLFQGGEEEKKYFAMQTGKQSSSFMNDHTHGFITEKMYMVLQLFLTNKGQPSIELINLCSADFNINYLQ